MAEPDRLKVTVSDVVTGEVLGEKVIYDDYLLICAGHPHLAHTQAYANGTHVLTIKHAGNHGIQDLLTPEVQRDLDAGLHEVARARQASADSLSRDDP